MNEPGPRGFRRSVLLQANIDSACDRFETTWQSGRIPWIEDYLPASPTDPPPAWIRDLLVELVCLDLHYRWQRAAGDTVNVRSQTAETNGHPTVLPNRPRLEDYVARYPLLGPIGRLPDKLVIQEYQVRKAAGDNPKRVEYLRRFSQQAARLASLFREQPSSCGSDDDETPTASRSFTPQVRGQVAERLIKAGLVSAKEIAILQSRLAGKGAGDDGAPLLDALVAAGQLTRYQADLAARGKCEELVLADYLILERLGGGGMGEVYRARHRTMDRIVALKILSPKLVDSAEAVTRFRREAKAAARLIHPNIVIALDAGEQEGRYYLVTEYVDGPDLERVADRRGRLPLSDVLDYIVQAARGLEFAHRHGIIHRDVKPANLLLTHSGMVKVLDLGLARTVGLWSEQVEAQRLTGSGQIMGTCDYMAPEQAQDTRLADARSDVYSLGCTLYRLLVGHCPYPAETLVSSMTAHRTAPIPSLACVRDDVPLALDVLYHKMLAKRPQDRPQSMAEVIAAVEGLQARAGAPPLLRETTEFDGASPPPPDSPRRRDRR